MPAAPVPSFENNRLLQALSDQDRDLVVPYLEAATVRRGEVLFEAGREVQTISFPCGQAVVSLLITMQDGRRAETATIGREGAVGGIVSNGRIPASTQALVQIGGPVLRIDSARLQEAKRRSGSLRNLLSRYGDCLLAQVLQSVACNALHPIEQRCLRWLLTLQDRLGTDELPVTHELLAAMLGVQRTYLTRVLSTLQGQGLIRVARGRIHVIGRPEMEAGACECHAVVRQHYETVMGGPLPAALIGTGLGAGR